MPAEKGSEEQMAHPHRDSTRFGLTSKPRAPEIQRLSRHIAPLYALGDEIFEHQLAIHEAHVVMLERQSILSAADAALILSGISELEKVAVEDRSILNYMTFESRLIDLVGPIGGAMHTGRSRDDMANCANRMHYRSRIIALVQSLNAFRKVLVGKAGQHLRTVTMAYTHNRQAQPVTLAHVLMGQAESLGQHIERYFCAYERINLNPLGSAASAGTIWPLDRDLTTSLLGFDGLVINTLEGVAGWDHIAEFSSANSILMASLARLANELTFWQSDEFALIDIDAGYTGNSSLMPHKKNPNILEFIRSFSAKVLGDHMSLMSSLTLSPYQHISTRHVVRDDAIDGVIASVDAMAGMISTLTPNVDRMLQNSHEGFGMMTSLADYLSRTFGLPFRISHEVVATLVVDAVSSGRDQRGIDAAMVRHTALDVAGCDLEISDDAVREILDSGAAVDALTGVGAPGPQAVMRHIDLVKAQLTDCDRRIAALAEGLQLAAERRLDQVALLRPSMSKS
ncbi:argininosuccinate lyase [Devosia sp. 2618]|uniref:argininosuccinate lyase n=1 Tax=Devosia sp. 2618 TaxID=3156454 RepID=UPI0033973438